MPRKLERALQVRSLRRGQIDYQGIQKGTYEVCLAEFISRAEISLLKAIRIGTGLGVCPFWGQEGGGGHVLNLKQPQLERGCLIW